MILIFATVEFAELLVDGWNRGTNRELGLRNYKFREATIQTDQKLWKDPHDGLVQILESGT